MGCPAAEIPLDISHHSPAVRRPLADWMRTVYLGLVVCVRGAGCGVQYSVPGSLRGPTSARPRSRAVPRGVALTGQLRRTVAGGYDMEGPKPGIRRRSRRPDGRPLPLFRWSAAVWGCRTGSGGLAAPLAIQPLASASCASALVAAPQRYSLPGHESSWPLTLDARPTRAGRATRRLDPSKSAQLAENFLTE